MAGAAGGCLPRTTSAGANASSGKGIITRASFCVMVRAATASGGAAPQVVGEIAAGVDEGALGLVLAVKAQHHPHLIGRQRAAAMHARRAGNWSSGWALG